MLNNIICWYHLLLSHSGSTRMYNTIKVHFYHPSLKERCENFVHTCDICQHYKQPLRGYGELPPRQALTSPWYEVSIDLMGPWKITVFGNEYVFFALTVIDTVTNLMEITCINNKTFQHVAEQFNNAWLVRYPRPQCCVHDQGTEYLGAPFQDLLNNLGIHSVATTVRNPQSNAINVPAWTSTGKPSGRNSAC
jgi:transposase InsO family protein